MLSVCPTEIQDIVSLNVSYGVNATFVCNASGAPNPALPNPAYTWVSVDSPVPENEDRLSGINTANLVITNVSSRDDGTYRCEVRFNDMLIGSREAELTTRGLF